MYKFTPTFKTTGCGSVPFTDPESGMKLITEANPAIPYWPQLVSRNSWEDVFIQFSKGLPALKVDLDQVKISVDPDADMAAALTTFYEAEMEGDLEPFSLTTETAAGFFSLLEWAKTNPNRIERLKGQVTGPVTFCLGCMDVNDRSVIHNPDLSTAYARGIGLNGAWQATKLSSGFEPPLIFIDEPAMTGFGSAFMALDVKEVVSLLNTTIEPIHEAGGLCGIHVCGNTDWSTILKTEVDIVNPDVFGFGQEFVLYTNEIKDFLEEGGIIAWGLIPTVNFSGMETVAQLEQILEELIDHLVQRGIDRNLIKTQSMITPSCGLGSLSGEDAEKILQLLSETGKQFAYKEKD
jgi:methionine synthase II (cobalamin-independent)